MDTLPTKLVDETRAKPGDIGVIVQTTNRHTLKVTPSKESTLLADDAGDQDDTIIVS